jgi:hypothetical protein
LDLLGPSSSSRKAKKIFSSFDWSIFKILGSRSPNRYLHSRRDHFLRSYDKINFDDGRPRADQLLADFQDLLLQIYGNFRSKEESLHSPTPVGIQIEHLSADFTYMRSFVSSNAD